MRKNQLFAIIICIVILSSVYLYTTSDTNSRHLKYIFKRKITFRNKGIKKLNLSENYTTFNLLMKS